MPETNETPQEAAKLSAAPLEPQLTVEQLAPTISKTATPLAWWRLKSAPRGWPLACLAAAMAQWDPRQEDEEEVSEQAYDLAVAKAASKFSELHGAAAGATPPRRAVIMEHPLLMHAVVAALPALADVPALVAAWGTPVSPADGARLADLRAAACWQRVLWPDPDGASQLALEARRLRRPLPAPVRPQGRPRQHRRSPPLAQDRHAPSLTRTPHPLPPSLNAAVARLPAPPECGGPAG